MTDMEMWSIYESSLQSYRSIFISSQSFLLAVGAIVSGKDTTVLLAITTIYNGLGFSDQKKGFMKRNFCGKIDPGRRSENEEKAQS